MLDKKIFILLPDGIGLRNFAYSNFCKIGKNQGFDVVFWNNTPFPLTELGLEEIKIQDAKTHPATDVYKNVKIQAELNLNIKKTGDHVYDTYRFPFTYTNLKTAIKSITVQLLTARYSTEKGLRNVRKKMNHFERKTKFYEQSLATLKKEKPSLVFCTNQRPVLAIAPLLAAKDLGIPTATFIFSWDNLPKATLIVETDYYFVWSAHMKSEMLFYYPDIDADRIFITGTPQFEIHFDQSKIISREQFFHQNNLDLGKRYICFSGDDSVTSPDDPQYLDDFAKALLTLNKKGNNLAILFRRCPVDLSDRYDSILEKYGDLIREVRPLWKPISTAWNTILPTKEDGYLLSNIAEHCELVVNIGSTTIFDFVTHNKPCGYFRYNQDVKTNPNWDIFKCYRFVHFRTMPNKDAVIWFDNKDEIVTKIESILKNSQHAVSNANKWFEVINQHPVQEASKRIWANIAAINTKNQQY